MQHDKTTTIPHPHGYFLTMNMLENYINQKNEMFSCGYGDGRGGGLDYSDTNGGGWGCGNGYGSVDGGGY